MKIKKLWLAVLTVAIVYAMGTFAYAGDTVFYSENYIRAYGDEKKVYIELPTSDDENDKVEDRYIDKAIEAGINDGKGPIKDDTEIEIVILSGNYQKGLTSGMIKETALSNSKYKNRITSMRITGAGTIYIPKLVYDCPKLTSVTIEDTVTVTQINDSAFSGCTGLTSIVIPEGVTSICDNAFSGCTGLESIVIPEGVETIGNNAFSGCENLTSVVIPEGVETIGNNAFSDCTNLTSIVIPESVTSIGTGAFLYCTSLENIVCYSDGTKEDISWLDCFYDENEESYYIGDCDEWGYDDDEAKEQLENITKEITVSAQSSGDTSGDSSNNSAVDIFIDGIAVSEDKKSVSFDVKVDTSEYGGDDAKYLDSVYVILNDLSNGATVDKSHKLEYCYENEIDGKTYLIFPVDVSNENGSEITSLSIRGEVKAGSGFRDYDKSSPYYYASSAEYTSKYVSANTTESTDSDNSGNPEDSEAA